MYPYFTIRWTKMYMTGIGIVIAFLSFTGVVFYLTKRYLQSFWKFFYRLPVTIILIYFLWSYTQFILSSQQLFPSSGAELLKILSPYGYKFHFAWILAWVAIAITMFMKKVKTTENKKIWSDIFFFGISLCIIPLGIFLLLGDNFIGLDTDSFLWIKSLHIESQRNKFNAVYPVGLFLSIVALLSAVFIRFKKYLNQKRFGYGFLWFAVLLIVINIVLMFQQYPRYLVFGVGWLRFDIKQHISFFIIMLCLYTYNKLTKQQEVPKVL